MDEQRGWADGVDDLYGSEREPERLWRARATEYSCTTQQFRDGIKILQIQSTALGSARR